MRRRLPATRRLASWAREALPALVQAADGERLLADVRRIQATDQWTSFDRYAETSANLAEAYAGAGAEVEVRAYQTGAAIGTGRWALAEATDVRSATVDLLSLEGTAVRLIDYAANPWHVARWSGSTPAGGIRGELVVVDDVERLARLGPQSLRGRIVLTSLGLNRPWLDHGAAVVIDDSGTPGDPDATPWRSFGWGVGRSRSGGPPPVGLVLSAAAGASLRRLVRERGRLDLEVKVDIRRYVGEHQVVSGVVAGLDRGSEVWCLAHDMEPGAADNAAGVAVTLEIARLLAQLPSPRRSIRLLNGFECYGFFAYLEHERRFDVPVAGLCVDTIGLRPALVSRRLEWHATVPMSAGFVNHVGTELLTAAMRLRNPGYRLHRAPFVSTADTLIGDPKYGFPCPWLATWSKARRGYCAYHTSSDQPELLSGEGLALAAGFAAAYLYYLANLDTPAALELARRQTAVALDELSASTATPRRRFVAAVHAEDIARLRRCCWGGETAQVNAVLASMVSEVAQAARLPEPPPLDRRIPRRTTLLTIDLPNSNYRVRRKLRAAKLPPWAVYWADGDRDIATIAELLTAELGRPVSHLAVAEYFDAHDSLEYVDLRDDEPALDRSALIADLEALGLGAGMEVIVHSSLAAIGQVRGGGATVVEALLTVLGPEGTLLAPSFNFGGAPLYNPLATRCWTGAVAEALRCWPEALRSDHPSHALAGVGRRAAWYLADHAATGCWTTASPLGRLVSEGGWVLSLGVDHRRSTVYHVGELAAPCRCIDPFGLPGRAVGADGVVREVRRVAFRAVGCPVPLRALNAAMAENTQQRHGRVGQAEALLAPAVEVMRTRRDQVAPVCASCRIRPERQD